MNDRQPLVSVIVATRNRPQFLQQALRCFERQTWTAKELIVADGGDDDVEALCRQVPMVRHVRIPPETSVGRALDIAAEHAGGEIIQHIDDDDYYHPRFLERAVRELLNAGRTDLIVAWDCFNVLVAGENRLRFSGHGWTAGSTLCFDRSTWERTRFGDERAAEDHSFIQKSAARIHAVCAPELFLYVRHGRNHWRDLRGVPVDDYFRSLPPGPLTVQDVVDPRDVAFYAGL